MKRKKQNKSWARKAYEARAISVLEAIQRNTNIDVKIDLICDAIDVEVDAAIAAERGELADAKANGGCDW